MKPLRLFDRKDVGKILLNELRIPELTPFNTIDYNRLLSETGELRKKIEEIKNTQELTEAAGISYMLIKNRAMRNRKIAETYITERRLKIIRGNCDSKNMNKDEKIFNEKYRELTEGYMENFPILSNCSIEPPISLYVQIFVKEDCGYVMDEDELILLEKNKVYFLKKRTVAHLLSSDRIKLL